MNKQKQHIGYKPLGLKGSFAGILMNSSHAGLYKKIIYKYAVDSLFGKTAPKILDIGCGGGKVLDIFSSALKNAKLFGIDHSEDMVKMARRVNKSAINFGKTEITLGLSSALPYPDNQFNLITAFDTINYWDDFENSAKEIMRTLADKGIFMIVNAYPREGTKWRDFVKFKNSDEYRSSLGKSGFKEIRTFIENNTIIILAHKME